MAKYYGLATLLFLLPSMLCAQENGRMETDRPDQTESPFITRQGYVQGEFGFNLEKEGEITTLVHPTALLKYGWCNRFELRLITEIVSQSTPLRIPTGNKVITGLLPIKIGAKLALAEEKGILPTTAILFHIAPPRLSSRAFRASRWAPDFRFSMQHTLSNTVSLGYNLGAEWDGAKTSPYWIYTIGPGVNLGKKWYAYAELFGAVQQHAVPDHQGDIGLAYYINDDLKLDASSGTSLVQKNNWYTALGISFRFH